MNTQQKTYEIYRAADKACPRDVEAVNRLYYAWLDDVVELLLEEGVRACL